MIDPRILATFGICLGLTIILETAFALFVGIRGRKNLLLVVLLQVVTNPLAVLTMLWCSAHHWPNFIYQLPIETVVVVVEWLFYKKYLSESKRPFALSLGANYFSYSFGIVLGSFGLNW